MLCVLAFSYEWIFFRITQESGSDIIILCPSNQLTSDSEYKL